MIWGPEELEGKIRCLVSVGTGLPPSKLFKDDVLHIGTALVALATGTEQKVERFRRDKVHLDESSRYYRFNVTRGLVDIGLEESKEKKEIAAATRQYVGMQDILKQMQACTKSMARIPCWSCESYSVFGLSMMRLKALLCRYQRLPCQSQS